MHFRTDPEFAFELDEADELARFRHQFVPVDPDVIHLDCHSTGRLAKRALPFLAQTLSASQERRRVEGQHRDQAVACLGRVKLARILGVSPDEVFLTESKSVALVHLVTQALAMRPGRSKIVSDSLNSCHLEALIRLFDRGHGFEWIRSAGPPLHWDERLGLAVDENTALVSLSHVSPTSALLHDLAGVSATTRRAGALVLWDLSHSAGSVPIDLAAARADFAIGSTNQYLNGGPGSPTFLYVRRGLQDQVVQAAYRWGRVRPGEPDPGPLAFPPSQCSCALPVHRAAGGLACGAFHDVPCTGASGVAPWGSDPGGGVVLDTQLSLKTLELALDLTLEAGIDRLWAKSQRLTEYLIFLAEMWLRPQGFRLASPRRCELRGSHVVLRHREGWRIDRALKDPLSSPLRILSEFRRPDTIHLGVAPLYTSYREIYRALDRLRHLVLMREYESGGQPPVSPPQASQELRKSGPSPDLR